MLTIIKIKRIKGKNININKTIIINGTIITIIINGITIAINGNNNINPPKGIAVIKGNNVTKKLKNIII